MRKLALAAMIITLTACGGGGGGGGDGGNGNILPTVSAGPDQQVLGGDTVTLSGSASDPDGSIASYSWTQISGTSVTLQGASSATATFTAPNATELLRFRLTVTDNVGATASDVVDITVDIDNTPPSANAGADQQVASGDVVTLAGSGSDPDGSIASYSWTQVSGTAVSLQNAATATASFTAPDVAGALQFRLTVTDDDGATGSDTVTITVEVPNTAPTADAGPGSTVPGGEQVTLDGSGSSDPDQTTASLGFQWQQTSGPAVTLSGADTVQATFTAPDVANDTVLAFRLTVTDDEGASDTDTVSVTVRAPDNIPASVTINGSAKFEFVNRAPLSPGSGTDSGTGLDFTNIEERPIRGATVQAISSPGNAVLATTVTSAGGTYALDVPSQTDVFIRIRAELKKTGAPAWDVEVRDNTSETTLPLSQRPIYVLDGPVLNSGVADSTRDLLAETGWTGSAYTEPRAAAPFSILDVMYRATQFVVAVDPDVSVLPLDVFWSVNNTPAAGNIALGEIGTSFYNAGIDSLFLLGDAAVDTEEFDTHVVAHEWGHHFEQALGRTDSPGGPHTLNARLDARLAFGEGWGNAVGAMIMGDPIYFDTFAGDSFGFSLETYETATAGWYNESSVQTILWDLFDSTADDSDTLSLGFGPIYDVLTGSHRTTLAVTSVFSFIDALKAARPGDSAAIDALVGDENIDAVANIWGDGETNDPGTTTDVTPVHAELVLGAGPVNVCTTREFATDIGNRLGLLRYLRFTVNSAGNYRISLTTTNPPAGVDEYSDPDFFLLERGVLVDTGATGAENSESIDVALPAGTYVVELLESGFPNVYGLFSNSAPFAQDTMCFDVTLTQL